MCDDRHTSNQRQSDSQRRERVCLCATYCLWSKAHRPINHTKVSRTLSVAHTTPPVIYHARSLEPGTVDCSCRCIALSLVGSLAHACQHADFSQISERKNLSPLIREGPDRLQPSSETHTERYVCGEALSVDRAQPHVADYISDTDASVYVRLMVISDRLDKRASICAHRPNQRAAPTAHEEVGAAVAPNHTQATEGAGIQRSLASACISYCALPTVEPQRSLLPTSNEAQARTSRATSEVRAARYSLSLSLHHITHH